MAISVSRVFNFNRYSGTQEVQLIAFVQLTSLKLNSSFIGNGPACLDFVFEVIDTNNNSIKSDVVRVCPSHGVMIADAFKTVTSSTTINSFVVKSIRISPLLATAMRDSAWHLMFSDTSTVNFFHHSNIVYDLKKPMRVPINVNNMGLRFIVTYNNGIIGQEFELRVYDDSAVGVTVKNFQLQDSPHHIIIIGQFFHKLHLTTSAFEIFSKQPMSNYAFNVSVYEEY